MNGQGMTTTLHLLIEIGSSQVGVRLFPVMPFALDASVSKTI